MMNNEYMLQERVAGLQDEVHRLILVCDKISAEKSILTTENDRLIAEIKSLRKSELGFNKKQGEDRPL